MKLKLGFFYLTALMFAATEGNIKTVQELLTKENIDITAKNI